MNTKEFLLILCCSLLFCSIDAQIIYVKSDGQGDGTSWNQAFGDLQTAINSASTGTEVWIAAGEYFPTQCDTCSTQDRSIAFQPIEGVALYGGFSGNESSKEQRDLSKFKTILNGDIGIPGDRRDNSYSILVLNFPNIQNIVDGIEFRNGNADGAGDSLGPNKSGGAIHILGKGNGGAASPIIKNCSFYNNRSEAYGGAIHFYGGFSGSSIIDLRSSHFEGNSTGQKGGAIYGYAGFSGSITGYIQNCQFIQNRAFEGGAVHLNSAESGTTEVIFKECNFEYGSSLTNGGAVTFFTSDGINTSSFIECNFLNNSSKRGGAVFNDGSANGSCNTGFFSCTFLSNTSVSGGAAIYNNGTSGESSPYFQNCLFKENFSIQSGGAIFNSGANNGICLPIIDKCRFVKNETTMYGAGMYNFGKTGLSSPIITNCLFSENISDSGTSIYNYGGLNGNSNPQIINCTFTKNIARVGPCIYNQASDTSGTVMPFVSHCIFWDNISTSGFGLVFQNGYAEPTIQYSLIPFDDCAPLNTQPNSSVNCGNGIIFNQNPNFIDGFNRDYRLDSLSPAINIGMSSTILLDSFDLDNRVRQIDNIDLGAYEWDPTAVTMIAQQPRGGNYCEGEELEISIQLAGPQPLEIQWYQNGIEINSANQTIFNIPALQIAHFGDYWCKIVSSTNVIHSDTITINVNAIQHPEIELLTNAEKYCQGDSLLLIQAGLQNAGFYFEIEWQLNDLTFSGDSPWFSFVGNGLDSLKATLSSSGFCIDTMVTVSNNLVFEKMDSLDAGITIAVDEESYCEGDTLQGIATIENGGLSPILNWTLNNEDLTFADAQIYISDFQDGDILTASLVSDYQCIRESLVFSDPIEVNLTPVLNPTFVMNTVIDSFCKDSTANFSINLQNEGSQTEIFWYLNEELVEENVETFSTVFDSIGFYEISARFATAENCVFPSEIEIDPVIFEVVDCFVSGVKGYDELLEFQVYPNPTSAVINISISNKDVNQNFQYALLDIHGNAMLMDRTSFINNHFSLDLSVFNSGCYFLKIFDSDRTIFRRISVLK